MRIFQLSPSFTFGDAVGNDMLALQTALTQMGYRGKIYADTISPDYLRAGVAEYTDHMPTLEPQDVLIYHLATGTRLHALLPTFPCRKIGIYHNITPPAFFLGYAKIPFQVTQDAYLQMEGLRDVFDYMLADSQYNKDDLLRMGFSCPIDVLPILMPFEDYKCTPALSVARKYADGRINLLFVGRIAPNKKHEDIIAAYAAYKQHFDPSARLFLVGGTGGLELYATNLRLYAESLGLTSDDVVFPGHISFEEILGFYSISHLFLCMSEHEGFCVPLIEAMLFDLPIVAYASSAVPETLGNAGVLLETKDPFAVACTVHRVLNDSALRETLRQNAQQRLTDFSTQAVTARFTKLLANFLAKKY